MQDYCSNYKILSEAIDHFNIKLPKIELFYEKIFLGF